MLVLHRLELARGAVVQGDHHREQEPCAGGDGPDEGVSRPRPRRCGRPVGISANVNTDFGEREHRFRRT